MLKRWASNYGPMVVLLILIGAILGMSRYAEHRKGENPNDAQASSPQAPITPNDASKSAENTDKAKHRPDFIDTFTWPEGATVWALFLTLIVIAWQSAETRKSASAATIAMQQWVNIVPVGISRGVVPHHSDICEVSLRFEIVNKTDYLMTILRIETNVGANVHSSTRAVISLNFSLVPQKSDGDSSLPFFAKTLVDAGIWNEKGRIFVVTGHVTYLDCMGDKRTQPFEDLYLGMEDGELRRMKPSGIAATIEDNYPKYETENPN